MTKNSANLLRLLSIIAVIIIHATSKWEVAFSHSLNYFSNSFLGVILNQISRFSVPVFIFLSGYGLTKKYNLSWNNNSFSITLFFKRRFSKIGIPFLFFTILFLIIQNKFQFLTTTQFPQNLKILFSLLFEKLCLTGADYHFYFFIIILELYLLFPLLRKIKYQIPFFFLLLTIHLLYNSPSHLLFQVLSIKRFSFPSSFFIYWILYFYSGIIFASHEKYIRQKLLKFKKQIFTLLIISIFLVFYDYLYFTHKYYNNHNATVDWYNHFNRISITFYFFNFIAFFVILSHTINNYLKKKKNRILFIETGAQISFTVYILHTTVLRLLSPLKNYLDVFSFVIIIILISFGFVYLLNKFLHITIVRKILGLP